MKPVYEDNLSRFMLFLVSLFLLLTPFSGRGQSEVKVIPYPAKVALQPDSFMLSQATVLVNPDGRFAPEADHLQEMLNEYLGAKLQEKRGYRGVDALVLRYDNRLKEAESYRLDINKQRIILSAGDAAGLFYAVETLRQMLPATPRAGAYAVPAVEISDTPAFPWRGMMLDVSRHFFSIDYLKRFADRMAMYKLNKLHLHLTDDQGWRIEIKKYPRLTSEGAWRTFNNHDLECIRKAEETGNDDFRPDSQHIIQKNGQTLYGGFYTQEEMREFIRYAAERHIEVIPEIDMPGHMMAATRIYPELTCDDKIGSVIGVFSNPICPCKEEVLDFAKDIFSEIADLFPSRYIHIGGDEVNKKSWQESARIQAFMKEKGYTRIEQVQSYFNDLMLNFFRSKGKVMLGWDEIVEGGIDSSAQVMYWRGWVPEMPSHAASAGHGVIMSPSGPLYFDALPDALTLPSVYNYRPLDPEMYRLSKDSEKRILGVQANVWTEMIPSEKRVDYMVMPRMTALAEVGWSQLYRYESYLERLNAQYERWDGLNMNYRLPDLTELVENYALLGKTPFFVASPQPRFQVRYTLDGSLPAASSPLMDEPVILEHATVMKLALFTPAGRRGDVYTLNFNEQQLGKQLELPDLENGLRATYHKGYFKLTTEIKTPADSTFTAYGIGVPPTIKAPAFGLKFRGYLQVPDTGIYTFYLTCNDGGVLYIGEQKIIDNDGLHPDKTKGGQAGLQKGLHPFSLDFMDYGGGYALDLKYSFGGGTPQPVPASWFKSKKP